MNILIELSQPGILHYSCFMKKNRIEIYILTDVYPLYK